MKLETTRSRQCEGLLGYLVLELETQRVNLGVRVSPATSVLDRWLAIIIGKRKPIIPTSSGAGLLLNGTHCSCESLEAVTETISFDDIRTLFVPISAMA